MVASVRPAITRRGRSAGKRMAMLTVEDLTGKCDAVVFAETYERVGDMLNEEAMVFLVGSIDRSRERPNLIVDDVVPIDRALEELTAGVLLRLPPAGSDVLKRLYDIMICHRGEAPIQLEVRPARQMDVRVTIRPQAQWRVRPTRKLVSELSGLLGAENVVLLPKPPAPPNGNGRGRFARNGAANRQKAPQGA
jgi:DNA polymerase-3 subunit alpha